MNKWVILLRGGGGSFRNSAGLERYIESWTMMYRYYGPTFRLPDDRYVYASDEGSLTGPYWRFPAHQVEFDD